MLVNALSTDIWIDKKEVGPSDETKFCAKFLVDVDLCNPYLSPYPLLKLTIQVMCMFVFVLFKTPKDCFICYSKATNIKYSIFQYVHYVYTEQFLTV